LGGYSSISSVLNSIAVVKFINFVGIAAVAVISANILMQAYENHVNAINAAGDGAIEYTNERIEATRRIVDIINEAKDRLRDGKEKGHLVILLPTLNPFTRTIETRVYRNIGKQIWTMTGGRGGRILGAAISIGPPVQGVELSGFRNLGQAHYHAMKHYPNCPFTVHLHVQPNMKAHVMLYPEKAILNLGGSDE
jgi:hypothetical protein